MIDSDQTKTRITDNFRDLKSGTLELPRYITDDETKPALPLGPISLRQEGACQ